MKHCPFCGWPDDEPYDVVSRHRTTAGQTVWTRCACGSLQTRVIDLTGSRIVARSRPASPVTATVPADCPSC